MKIKLHICLALLLLFTALFPNITYAESLKKQPGELYFNGDYESLRKLLEDDITNLKQALSKGNRRAFRDLREKHLILAYIQAWKLGDFDMAIQTYQDLIQLRSSFEEGSRFPSFECLLIADIYERKNDFARARENYEKFIEELIKVKDREHDDVLIIMADEFIRFARYQIDSIKMKNGNQLLLPQLKLSSLMFHCIAPYCTIGLVPTAEYETHIAMKTGLLSYIKESPPNVVSMLFNYTLFLNSAAGTVNKSSERAMEAYLSKYSESYGALLLSNQFYKYYRDSGQHQKAEKLLTQLKAVAEKRGMELIVEPDERFSSPEKTWATFTKALLEGDLDLAMECQVPGSVRYEKFFDALDKEEIKKVAAEMNPIKKIKIDSQVAEYVIYRKEDGKTYAYDIYFSNINGEWKIAEY